MYFKRDVIYFKPGDVIVDNETNKLVYLILEVHYRKIDYKIFVLNHPNPLCIGKKYDLFINGNFFKLLKNVNLNEI